MRDKANFEALKQAVEARFQEGHPHCHVPISAWKGQWIVDFQEDLLAKVQGRVSEKWFYTYFRKAEVEKLPRIDMLNLLSRYSGYANWAELCSTVVIPEAVLAEGGQASTLPAQGPANPATLYRREEPLERRPETSPEPESPTFPDEQVPPRNRNRFLIIGGLILIAATTAILLLQTMSSAKVRFEIEFIDSFTRAQVEHLPQARYENSEGNWLDIDHAQPALEGNRGDQFRMTWSGGYCHPDTVTLTLPSQGKKVTVQVRPDDFALMIHIFSQSGVKDWKNRREKLDRMIAEEAEIFQVDARRQLGMEMYNKQEFINKLTMPVRGLQAIEILETKHDEEGRIKGLRFTQKNAP